MLPIIINGSSLSYQLHCRDLGVIINWVSPSTHISEIVAKTHQRTNIILRCFMSNDKRLLLSVFCNDRTGLIPFQPFTIAIKIYIEHAVREFLER